MAEPGDGEGRLRLRGRVVGDDQVQVAVGAGLAAQQRVDPPAAVQPHHQAGPVEQVEDGKDIGGVHERWHGQGSGVGPV